MTSGLYLEVTLFYFINVQENYVYYSDFIIIFCFTRIVFPHRKKSKKLDEIVHKKYILTSETFEFGPLLVGRNRDR